MPLNLTPEEITMVFGLPPAEAIAFFEKKGFVISWDWKDVWKHANVNAATIAKMTRLDLLQDTYAALEDNLKNGGSFYSFQRQIRPIMQAKGWWGSVEQTNRKTGEIRTVNYGSTYRLETIYETNLQVAYMAGRYQGLLAAKSTSPWWEYSAIMDSRTRPAHASLNGRVFRHDDPFWGAWYPPNGFRCRCRVIPRSNVEYDRGDFETSNGTGRMQTVETTIKRRDGTTERVQTTGYLDATGKVLRPDLGWDYNPGAERNRLDKMLNDKQNAASPAIREASKKHDN